MFKVGDRVIVRVKPDACGFLDSDDGRAGIVANVFSHDVVQVKFDDGYSGDGRQSEVELLDSKFDERIRACLAKRTRLPKVGDTVEIIGPSIGGNRELRNGNTFTISQTHNDYSNGEWFSHIGFLAYPASSLRVINHVPLKDIA